MRGVRSDVVEEVGICEQAQTRETEHARGTCQRTVSRSFYECGEYDHISTTLYPRCEVKRHAPIRRAGGRTLNYTEATQHFFSVFTRTVLLKPNISTVPVITTMNFKTVFWGPHASPMCLEHDVETHR